MKFNTRLLCFFQAQEQAAIRPATLIGSAANWAKRKATLNHVLRVRKDQVLHLPWIINSKAEIN